MSVIPEGVAAKVVWAERHLDLIRTRVTAYLDSEPYVIDAKFEENPKPWPTLKHIPVEPGWVGVARLRNPAPAELPLMVGDFLHNLRSSLDHLARGLVISNGGRPRDHGPGGRTAFPLHKVDQKKPAVSIVAESGGASATALALVEGLQPYNRRPHKAHPAFVLSELSNIDKHRTLHIPVVGTGQGMVFALINRDLNIAPIQPQIEPFDDGAVVSVVPWAWPRNANVEVKAKVPAVVTLQEIGPKTPEIVPLADALEALLKFVRDEAIPLFRSCFSGEWPVVFNRP